MADEEFPRTSEFKYIKYRGVIKKVKRQTSARSPLMPHNELEDIISGFEGTDEINNELTRLAAWANSGNGPPPVTSSSAMNVFLAGENNLNASQADEIIAWLRQHSSGTTPEGAYFDKEYTLTNLSDIYDTPTGHRLSNLLDTRLGELQGQLPNRLQANDQGILDLMDKWRSGQITPKEYFEQREKFTSGSNQVDRLNEEISILESGRASMGDDIYFARRREIFNKLSAAKRASRTHMSKINNIEMLADSMRNRPPTASGFRSNEDVHLLSIADQKANFFEKRGISAVDQRQIEAAAHYYRLRDSSSKSALDMLLYNSLLHDMNAGEMRRRGGGMPKDFHTYLKVMGINKGAEFNTIINDFIKLSTEDHRAITGQQRILKMGYQQTADFFKLYGLGALPTGAQEMGRAILASTGSLAGNEVQIVREQAENGFGPFYTNTTLHTRQLDGTWGKSLESTHLPYTPANSALRLRPRGFRTDDLSNMRFTLASEPEQYRPIHAFNLVDQQFHFSRAGKIRDEQTEEQYRRMSKALDQVNDQYGAVIQRHIGRAADAVAARGETSDLTEGADLFGNALGIQDLADLTPRRAAEELITGLMYNRNYISPGVVGADNKPFQRLLRESMRGETPFSQNVGNILRETAPDLMELGTKYRDKDLADVLKEWGGLHGIAKHNIARRARMWRTLRLNNEIEHGVNANYAIDRPSSNLLDMVQDVIPSKDITINGEALRTAMPYGFDTQEASDVRTAARKVFKRVGQEREESFRSMRYRKGSAFEADVRALVAELDHETARRPLEARQPLVERLNALELEENGDRVSLRRRMESIIRSNPELQRPENTALVVRLAKEQRKLERIQLESRLRTIDEGPMAELSQATERGIVDAAHKRMLQAAAREEEIRRIHSVESMPRPSSGSRYRYSVNPAAMRQILPGTRPSLNVEGPIARYAPAQRAMRAGGVEHFRQYISQPHVFSSIMDQLGPIQQTLGLRDFIEAPNYEESLVGRDVFTGRTADTVYQQLSTMVGGVFNVNVPGYTESYRSLFGEEQDLRMRLLEINPLGTNIQSNPTRLRTVFGMVSELTPEQKERQLAAYLLPTLKQDWMNDFTKRGLLRTDAGGMLSDAARREALGRARETLAKSNETHMITQQMEWMQQQPESATLLPQAEDFVREKIMFDEDGLFLTDEQVRHEAEQLASGISSNFKFDPMYGSFKPVPNSALLDEIQRTNRVQFLQNRLLEGAANDLPNDVTTVRHLENMALLRQALPNKPSEALADLGRTNVTVSDLMTSHIDSAEFMPRLGGKRMSTGIFDDAIAAVDEELKARGQSWDLTKDISNNFTSINLTQKSSKDRNMLRELMGLDNNARYVNSPLAKWNMIDPEIGDLGELGDSASVANLTLQKAFTWLTVSSRLDKNLADSLFTDELGQPLLGGLPASATRDEIANELYELHGIDMRVSTHAGRIADFLSARNSGILDERMRTILSEPENAQLDAVRERHGIGSVAVDAERAANEMADAAEAADDTAKYTRIWENPMREFRRLWNNPLGKAGVLGSAAFVATGLIHGRIAKDRTREDMQGPSSVPGGAPYQDAPMVGPAINQRPVQFNTPYAGGGVEYTVRATGNNINPDVLQSQVANMMGTTNISGSTYSYPSAVGTDNSDYLMNMYGQ